ncbi:MAG: hypothetical protein AN483_12600 [Aphanizomenon flos-aquae MDT14a]|uniref:Uncharacterized protein n=1 Tax=Aphanizomenon flos-aquae LD13 TaxID=1710894 RepID=A0A1B7VVI2_APHFL|nr:hypothetical protein [Aphanizomenon flos-aquae UKL13-PB]OBQ24983.1 MAG: hypothetical protein AN481_12690 [Aphanizomenon flos-aquae LD13]OBQ29074.1 MAG: hypothetical protein AN483_12600 [Aphanizomenon flos-aquae MDT14a]HCQ21635.1 hypothetical protein [Anabaena sp. UBA12330]
MMLNIKFYSKNGESPITIQLSREFYKRLAESDFSEIGISHKKQINIEEEPEEIEVIDLDKGKITNRKRLMDFFKEEIVEESGIMLEKLGEGDPLPSKAEYKEQTYSLRKFQEILKLLENTQYSYLQKST